MNKILKYHACIVCALFAIACEEISIGELDSLTENVEIAVTFEVESTIVTRAVSDGSAVDLLMYAIFTADGDQLVIRKAVKSGVELQNGGNGLTMNLSLPKGHEYKAVFWVQNSGCKAYNVSDDMQVRIDYNGANNDESRDAFFGVSDSFKIGDNKLTVTLRRPFAQLNAGTYPFDKEFAKNVHKFDVTSSSVRIYGIPDCINLFDGSVSGSIDAYFSAGRVLEESLFADVDENGEDEEYAYLSMTYVLADKVASTHTADFFFMNDGGQAVMFEGSGLETVTLQRNMSTDFVGQVLTDNGELNIRTYDNNGNTDNNSVYYNVAEETTICNTIYDMSDHASIQFGSENGQTITYENLLFTGEIWTIELGEYRGSSYVNYNNVLRNVEMRNLSVSSAIECHEWYFSPAVIAYGMTKLYDCVMKGTTTIRTPITDKHGIEHEVIPVDIGIRNESDAIIDGGEYGTVFAWTHAVVNIRNAVIDMLYCGTCDSTEHSWMTIEQGTKIRKIRCCEPRCPYGTKEYSTTMTIKSGADIGELELVSTDVEFLIIEEGAKVGRIVCEGVEYTYKELREAMGL